MVYRSMLGIQALGTSELEYRDSAQGIAFGMYQPFAPY
jgi:hypothetical protein